MKRETLKTLNARVGGLSDPSKMPGYAYGIPASKCGVGSILRKKLGSVCSKCYAQKGRYVFENVQTAQFRRLDILLSDLDSWKKNMVAVLKRALATREKYFRWHDSGDLQSFEHLTAIVWIAKQLPMVHFWLPTKEYSLIREWIKRHGSFPRNLAVRVSAPMIGRTVAAPLVGTVSSTVGARTGFACEAYQRGGHCDSCRACWDKTVKVVDYPQH